MEKESVKMWLARDKDGSLYLYCGEMFPRITWGNSPKRVAVTIEEGGQDA